MNAILGKNITVPSFHYFGNLMCSTFAKFFCVAARRNFTICDQGTGERLFGHSHQPKFITCCNVLSLASNYFFDNDHADGVVEATHERCHARIFTNLLRLMKGWLKFNKLKSHSTYVDLFCISKQLC